MIESGTFLQQRYRIDKQIGQGGMGAVYVATDERFNSTVAIKETLCMDDNFRKAIEREARLLNSLKHSALPRVSDHFVENAGQFLVMEYIQGEDLYEILTRDKRAFPVDVVLVWADQLLDALDYLHNQTDPVIHRDIKPQNLKLTSRGQIVLLDFGLAKGNPTDAGMNTAAKSIFGYSRNYASLEQIQGTGTDPRSDLYSLAATLYHLMTNTPPDDALTRAMSVLGRKGDPLRPANQIDHAIPAGVAGVLQKALALDANDRPSSAAEMKEMLHDRERYAHLATDAMGPVSAGDPQIFAQPTMLMPDETHAGAVKPTDLKTEVLPEYLSQVTSVRPGKAEELTGTGDPLTTVPLRRKLGLAAGTIMALLVIGSIAGVALILFGITTNKPAQTTVDQSPLSQPADRSTLLDSNVEVSQPDTTDSQFAANTDPADTVRQTSPPKQPEAATKAAKGSKAGTTNDQGDTVDLTSVDPNTGTVVITQRDKNGKVTTIRVNPKTVPPKVPVMPESFDPFPPGFDPGRQMTPAEREQLRLLMKNKMRQQANSAQQPPQ